MSESQSKRRRIVLSCDSCRKKKTKCDRRLPCSTCTKLSIAHHCSYSSPDHINHNKAPMLSNSANSPTDIINSSNNVLAGILQQEVLNLQLKLKHIESYITETETVEKHIPLILAKDLHEMDKGDEKINKKLLIGEKPNQVDDGYMNFHYDVHSTYNTRVCHPPLPIRFILQKEPGANLFWSIQKKKECNDFKVAYISRPLNSDDKSYYQLTEKAQKKYGLKYIKQIEDGFSIDEVKESITNYGTGIGVMFGESNLEDLNLKKKIIVSLPSTDIVNLYLKIFFEVLYPFMPIIDEMSFRSDLLRILGIHDGYGTTTKDILIEKPSDRSIIAILLYILRLSYLSLFGHDQHEKPKNSKFDDSETKLLLANPILMDLVTLATDCIKDFKLTRHYDFTLLQALIFERIYLMYAPELGDQTSGCEPQLHNGLLTQVAISLGLNREADYFLDMSISERIKNLRRKIWYFLVTLDTMDTALYGSSLSTDLLNYDTKIPFYKEGNSNIANAELEKEVIRSFQFFRPLMLSLIGVAQVLVNLKEKVKISSVMDLMSELELTTTRFIGRFEDFLRPIPSESDSIRIHKMNYYLIVKLHLVQLYFYFYVHYCQNGMVELEYFYFKKLTISLYDELSDVNDILIFKHERYFGKACSLILTPSLNLLGSISSMISASFSIRVTSTIRDKLKQLDPHSQNYHKNQGSILILRELLALALNATKITLTGLETASKRYYSAWKVKQAIMYSISVFLEEEVYTDDSVATKKSVLNYSDSQFSELAKIIGDSVQRNKIYLATALPLKRNDTFNLIDLMNSNTIDEKLHDDILVTEFQLSTFWTQLLNIRFELDRSTNTGFDDNDDDVKTPIANGNNDHVTIFPDYTPFFMDIFGEANFNLKLN